MAEIACGECGAPMVLRFSRRRDARFYGCSRYPDCFGTHGAHQATGEPMGVPADQPTKRARVRAHAAFDALWKGGGMTRTEAYGWLRLVLGLSEQEAHIGRMDAAACEQVIAVCARRTVEAP